MIGVPARRTRGISLIEAVVALAVMAFGMVAIVGLQATLRGNADVSRQRAEAVRIAQATVEQRRAFSVLSAASGVPARAFDAIVSQPQATVAGVNATFTVDETVVDEADPPQKTLVVDVGWQDRSGADQRVRIATRIAGTAPELAGALAVPAAASPVQQIGGRHRAIPPGAVQEDDGSSRFAPPGAPSVSWVFDNASGLITRTCVGGSCTDVTALLLSGHVRFATASAPLPADAEVPPSPAFAVALQVAQTAPSAATIDCYQQVTTSHVAYYCALPIASPTAGWSGRSVLAGLPLAASAADASASAYRVCRYTPVAGCDPAVGATVYGAPVASCSPPGTARAMSNADHPLDYAGVTTPLTLQDFLVIRAGDGTTPFACPADDPSTPLINGQTRRHQPLS